MHTKNNTDNKIYTYPAIFSPDKEHEITVFFPDWEPYVHGGTYGKTIEQAMWMAQDLLGLMCDGAKDGDWPMPKPSEITSIACPAGSTVKPVTVSMEKYYAIMEKVRRGRYRFRMAWKAWALKTRKERN